MKVGFAGNEASVWQWDGSNPGFSNWDALCGKVRAFTLTLRWADLLASLRSAHQPLTLSLGDNLHPSRAAEGLTHMLKSPSCLWSRQQGQELFNCT